jgi:catechol 2,3-dioxygenase-like lactoylglutathione lyase family enzyme
MFDHVKFGVSDYAASKAFFSRRGMRNFATLGLVKMIFVPGEWRQLLLPAVASEPLSRRSPDPC